MLIPETYLLEFGRNHQVPPNDKETGQGTFIHLNYTGRLLAAKNL